MDLGLQSEDKHVLTLGELLTFCGSSPLHSHRFPFAAFPLLYINLERVAISGVEKVNVATLFTQPLEKGSINYPDSPV